MFRFLLDFIDSFFNNETKLSIYKVFHTFVLMQVPIVIVEIYANQILILK
jgi:hypothetical protein